MRILVVEDSVEIAEMLDKLLGDEHEVIQWTYNFPALLESRIWEEVDVLIADLMLREITGAKILGHVKRHFPHVRTIVFSAIANLADIREDLAELADVILTKPCSTDIIKRAIYGGE